MDSCDRRQTTGPRAAMVAGWEPAVLSGGPRRGARHLRTAAGPGKQASAGSAVRGPDVPQRQAIDDALCEQRRIVAGRGAGQDRVSAGGNDREYLDNKTAVTGGGLGRHCCSTAAGLG